MVWLFALVACSGFAEPAPSVTGPAPTAAETTDPVLVALRANPLVATRHGLCRMACRHIDPSEVEHVLATGVVDPERTRLDGECPSYALEATTPDGQHARVVLAACATETRIVTVIDLDDEWPCTCD